MRQLALAPRCLQAYGHGRVKMTDIMRGYFGVGVEGVSKPFNIGNLMRSAHAFGAGFVFTIAAAYAGAGADQRRPNRISPPSTQPSDVLRYNLISERHRRIPTAIKATRISTNVHGEENTPPMSGIPMPGNCPPPGGGGFDEEQQALGRAALRIPTRGRQ